MISRPNSIVSGEDGRPVMDGVPRPSFLPSGYGVDMTGSCPAGRGILVQPSVGAVGWRRLCYDVHVHVGLTRSQQPMTIGDTSHVMWQANDGEGRSVGPYARTLGCIWLETLRRDAPLDRAR